MQTMPTANYYDDGVNQAIPFLLKYNISTAIIANERCARTKENYLIQRLIFSSLYFGQSGNTRENFSFQQFETSTSTS